MQHYLDELNTPQRDAVVNTDGPTLVIAGAGSGKTRVLTYRIAHLLEKGVRPQQVLALTFTNKAAREMQHRIAAIVGEANARNLWMGTFHSIFARILRIESEKLGYPSSFTIYDTADSKSLIKSILKEMKLSDKEYKPGDVLGRISSAKNDLVTPPAYARDVARMSADQAAKKPLVYEIYARYMKHCYQAKSMDFDDLLLNTNILFRDFPDVLQRYQQRFQYILVDEYQDTNLSQYRIIKKLAEGHQNICVVGDDAQSIYSFRGAKIENILNFRNDYPGYKIFKLEQNYRSTQTIVNAANSIIAKNKGQIQKNVFSEKESGHPIRVMESYSDVEEGYRVADDIAERRREHHYTYQDFAILYRTNAQSRIFEEALRKRGFAYKIYGGLSFYQRKEIKDLIAYFRMTVNPNDQESLKRVINYPARGIGSTTMDKLEAISAQTGYSIWQLINGYTPEQLGINAGTMKKLHGFVQLIRGFGMKLLDSQAADLAREIATASGIMADLMADKSVEGQSRAENVEELMNAIREFTTNKLESGEPARLDVFLEDVALLTDQDSEKPEDNDKVTLMTIHSAKGLEFKNVYIVGVEEGLFPSQMTIDSEQGVEEERRLFYVALTRAEEYAVMSYAKTRYKYGELKNSTASRFIREVDSQYLEVLGNSPFTSPASRPMGIPVRQPERPAVPSRFKPKASLTQRPATPSIQFNYQTSGGDYQAGMLVEHERFGRGVIDNIEGSFPNTKVTVTFEHSGTKQLLLKFAKLKILR
ncbi:DNA helicase-2/ATP-dependent DNA helicase PcrA [Breznakibacter xylanolyticus]|uniref:DNA 3'-5' helicase n=1 Tax=Breznakibacter xylanolyticus TaxID=990 RepID=A0A2W7NHP4_9BACT|nr:UvrD-helicase domain-containing protein [Breznakibacter xylanolyticus]MBN2743069.1 exodeoxyribonuclease V subunit gamma [Marinilabiliaceae bacterium]PZX19370.1 DNA helicase-2/ATP-dependent DNA helicase PcrA [Breznakibacter xylanolyticus]